MKLNEKLEGEEITQQSGNHKNKKPTDQSEAFNPTHCQTNL